MRSTHFRAFFPKSGAPFTQNRALPGGEIEGGDFGRLLARLCREKPFLPRPLARRLARAYGSRVRRVLGSARSMSELGRDYGAGLTHSELAYLAREEWARAAEDVLSPGEFGTVLNAMQQETIATALADIVETLKRPPSAH